MSTKTPLIKKASLDLTARNLVRAGLLSIIMSGLALSSCRNDVVYTRQTYLEGSLWAIRDTVKFDFNIEDTTGLYDFVVSLRNTTDYPYSNIFLFIHKTFPTGQRTVDTLEYILTNEYGKWLGSGHGFYRDNDILYRYNLRFPQSGNYRFDIIHAMRSDTLIGLDEVGITLRHAKYPPKNDPKK